MFENENRTWLGRSYFGRHWRGEYSLPVSYFLNGVLLTVLVVVLIGMISSIFQESSGLWITSSKIFGLWAFVAGLATWQSVGIWRSASNHPKRGGRVVWSAIAKILVVLGALQTGGLLITSGFPQMNDALEIVTGDTSTSPHSMRILNGGKEVEFSGGIRFGVADELNTLLEAAPEVHLIHLNSEGGRIREARKMRDLIRQRRLDTYTSVRCLSACTIAYLGGERRFVHHEARIGFHAADFPGSFVSGREQANTALIDELISFGIAQDFANKAFLTPHSDMWFPTHDELLASNFVSDISEGQFALTGLNPTGSKKLFSDQVSQVPLYGSIKRTNPDVYTEIVDILYDGAVKGRPEKDILDQVLQLVVDLVNNYLPYAADEALFDFAKSTLEQMEIIGRNDKAACHAYLFPEQNQNVDYRQYLSSDIEKRYMKVLEQIIVSGQNSDDSSNTQFAIGTLFEELIANIIEKHGENVLESVLEMNTATKENSCFVVSIYYSEVIAMGETKAAILLRDGFSGE